VQHDLGVAAVYFHKFLHRPDETRRWLGEDLYRRDYVSSRHSKVPDAVLIDAQKRVNRVIGYGGLYSADRLRRFHQNWTRRFTDYELW
jgi:hypothetical protein